MPRVENRPSRKFCFTLFLNGCDQAEFERQATSWTTGALPDRVRFIICQLERCPDTQRLHLQGYVETTSSVRFGHLHRHIHPGLSLRVANGTADENIAYCTKDESRVSGPWRLGLPGKQGTRSDLLAVQTAIKGGATSVQLWEDFFPQMVRYHRAFRAYSASILRAPCLLSPPGSEPASEPIIVHVFWGDTGCGKSRRAVYESNNPFLATVTPNGKGIWFDGYESGQDIILDDYAGELPCNYLKRLLDRYHFELPIKGEMFPRGCKRIFITSNTNPDDWYPEASPEDRAALRRRYTTVTHYSSLSPWCPPRDEEEIVLGSDFYWE